MCDDEGNPIGSFQVIEGSTKHTFSCKVKHHVEEWVQKCRSSRNCRPTFVCPQQEEIETVTNGTTTETDSTDHIQGKRRRIGGHDMTY